jgi:hypothetical protein
MKSFAMPYSAEISDLHHVIESGFGKPFALAEVVIIRLENHCSECRPP